MRSIRTSFWEQLASSGAADGLVAGAKVEAKFGGKGKYYPGTIEAVNSDGTFAILFDDGDKEPKAKREDVKLETSPAEAEDTGDVDGSDAKQSGKLREGDKVEARYRGKSRYYPGRISRDRGDGSYDIDYDDGEKETNVERSLINVLEPAGGGRGGGGGMDDFSVGMKVEARYRGKSRYYPGRISNVHRDGTCDIDYDDGEKESRVEPSLIKSLEPRRSRRGGGRSSCNPACCRRGSCRRGPGG